LSDGFILTLHYRDRVACFVQARAAVITTTPTATAAPAFTAFTRTGFTPRVVIAVAGGGQACIASPVCEAFAILRAFATLAAFTTFAVTSAACAARGTRTFSAVGV
jgi:hypothetical protein